MNPSNNRLAVEGNLIWRQLAIEEYRPARLICLSHKRDGFVDVSGPRRFSRHQGPVWANPVREASEHSAGKINAKLP
eukprot:5948163-Pyramimonas_sp.AAC.1